MSLYSASADLRTELTDQVRVAWERREQRMMPAEQLSRTIDAIWAAFGPTLQSQQWDRQRVRRWMKVVLHLELEPMTAEKLRSWAERTNAMLDARYGNAAASRRALEEIDHYLQTREDLQPLAALLAGTVVAKVIKDGKEVAVPFRGLWSHPQVISDLCDDLTRWRADDALERRFKGLRGHAHNGELPAA